MNYRGLIRKYGRFLPVSAKTPIVTLHEGNTDLVPAPRLAALIDDHIELYLKCEGQNPTGSFKDRGMTLAVSKAAEAGSKTVLCASTGNTSASAAAYAARAGMRCVVLLPKGAIALGKLAQALMHGAQVLAIDGNFDEALNMAREVCAVRPITLVNSVNPFRLEGQKTAAFEVLEQLGQTPDFHAIPVGNAGNISAYWRGYREAAAARMSKGVPVMLGFQAAGAAPIVRGKAVRHPETVATAIRIGNPASWKLALAARDESKGRIDAVTDRQILEAYRMVAKNEGVFCEPASAASIAGVRMLAASGYFRRQAKAMKKKTLKVVCVLTGHGLKDPDTAISQSPKPRVIQPTLKALTALL
jgi:threonine synthase